MSFSFDEFLASVDAPSEDLGRMREEWDEAMRILPGGTPPFLKEKEYLRSAEFCGLDAETIRVLNATAELIVANKTLLGLAWLLYWKMYIAAAEERRLTPQQCRQMPCLEKFLGDNAGAFYLLVALGIVPFLKRHHESLGAEEERTRETMLEMKSLMDNYRRAHKRTGIFVNQLYWIQYYLHGRIFFRIGRFEYWTRPYSLDAVRVYRNKKTRQILALVSADQYFNDDGFCDTESIRTPEKSYWRSKLEEKDGVVTGNPVTPDGRAVRKRISLSLDEWNCVLNKNSMVLDMHIPAGGKMDMEACRDSFMRAAEFHREHFPNLSHAAVVCGSWIFSPNLPEFMPPDSNLVSFCREVYMYPIASSCRDGIWFFFYQDKYDSKTAPRESSLQKTIAAHLDAGKDLRVGGMFFLLDDVEHFGAQRYRNNFPKHLLQ